MSLEIIFTFLSENGLVVMLFFLVAVVYSSVGFGGGSSYLAFLTLSSLAFTEIRTIALLCNIAVVSKNTYVFQKQHIYNYKKILPLILFSIPFAFLGGLIVLTKTFFFVILGFVLVFVALAMFFSTKIKSNFYKEDNINYKKNIFFGGIIGFLSGLVGIGGGIFLAPILHLSNWDTPKKIAATASLFIFVNSIAGLLGQFTINKFDVNWNVVFLLVSVVLIGSVIEMHFVRNSYHQKK